MFDGPHARAILHRGAETYSSTIPSIGAKGFRFAGIAVLGRPCLQFRLSSGTPSETLKNVLGVMEFMPHNSTQLLCKH
jgi:hypothetical protein